MSEDVAATGVALVIGGTGVFGRLIVADLLTHTPLSIAVASRHGVAPRGWLPGSEGRVASTRLDARHEHALRAAIERTRACVVVHAAGPYALIGDAPLRAALGARIPYVDMCPRSDLFAELQERYGAAAHTAGVTCIVGASTAGGLTGLLTRRAQERLRTIDCVRSSLCVHNFAWGAGIVGDYLLSARRMLPHGPVGSGPDRVDFPGLGSRTVRLADTLDYVDQTPNAVQDVAYRIGLPDALPELGLRLSLSLTRLGVPMWRLARPLGVCAGLLGGSYTEGGLLHQAFGESTQGRGVLETHIHRAFGNVRNPSLLCALAADRLVRGLITTVGVIHPASWLAPSELIRALVARAVTVRTRFVPQGAAQGLYQQVPWEEVQ
jgi:NAD dependent epimerase/dehydratase family